VAALKKGRGRNAMKIERVFAISGLTREGCEALMRDINEYLESVRPPEPTERDVRFETGQDAELDVRGIEGRHD